MVRTSSATYFASWVLLSLFLLGTMSSAACCYAQPQKPKSLEALRDEAKSRVKKMEAAFEGEYKKTLNALKRIPTTEDSQRAKDLRKVLVPWADVFRDRFFETIESGKSKRLRTHLLRVMEEAGGPEIGSRLATLLGPDDNANLEIVKQLASMEDPGPDAMARLQNLLESKSLSAVLRGETLIALARMGAENAAAKSRVFIEAADAPLELKTRAINALSLTEDNPREDAGLIRRICQDPDVPPEILLASVRALGHYPNDGSLDARRILHDTLKEFDAASDPELVEATLDSLSRVGSKDTSKIYLVKFVKSDAKQEFRETGARLLARFGIKDGARYLLDAMRRDADENRKDERRQSDTARAFYDLHDYDDAITYWERALRRASSSRKYEILTWIARSYARLGNFEKAKGRLQDAGYKHFGAFAEDPAFATMRARAKYASLFSKKP